MEAGPALSTKVRRQMQAQRVRDTGPELAIRRLLHQAGLRYRVDVAPVVGLRRKADIVFPRQRVAVFVDGCFWHSCPIHATSPTNNAEWWATKLTRTVARDRETDRLLSENGWRTLRVWEHESPIEAAAQVMALVHASATPD